MIRRDLKTIKSICINTIFRYSTNSNSAYSDKLFKLVIELGHKGIVTNNISKHYGSNQIIDSDNDEQLTKLINNFMSPISFSFGYGSGVFEQKGNKKSKKSQIDMIHMVRDPVEFHKLNLSQFSGHYSGLKNFGGASAILKIQDLGAGVYFNPYVTMHTNTKKNNIIKYGTVSLEKSLIDLCEWSSLYMAGRLQKPVKYLKDEVPAIRFANQYNLKNAMAVGLFLIKTDKFDEVKLYETIAKISYMGDPRMLIGGENPNKVKNIVSKQLGNFQRLYEPLLGFFLENEIILELEPENSRRQFQKCLGVDKTTHILASLPLQFRRRLYKLYETKFTKELSHDPISRSVLDGIDPPSNESTMPFARAIAEDTQLRKNIVRSIKYTVAFPALVQTIKGIFSAGILKSIKYAWEKNTKYRKS